MVWLDERLTLNERQFVKLAVESGVAETGADDTREVFRRVAEKTELLSEAAAQYPHLWINFEQFPEVGMASLGSAVSAL